MTIRRTAFEEIVHYIKSKVNTRKKRFFTEYRLWVV